MQAHETSLKTLSPSVMQILVCYSQHVPLLNNASLKSESGVQQGDPLGPFLFSLTLWPVIEKLGDAVPNLTQHTWYLDDGFVAG